MRTEQEIHTLLCEYVKTQSELEEQWNKNPEDFKHYADVWKDFSARINVLRWMLSNE